jgi:L-iditol 2-dehydrogenase
MVDATAALPATMRRAELLRPGAVELREVPVPRPGPGELLVRVDVALTCGTDLKTYQRGHARIPLPAPMGHELAGTVAAAGPRVTRFREGDALASVPTAPCGACRLCRAGRESLCPDAIGGIVLGAFGEYVLLPARLVETNVFHRPERLTAEVAAALEPLACVVHGAARVPLERAESVVLLGDGAIALLFVQLARLRGEASVLVAGRHAERLRIAGTLGARTTTATGEQLSAEILEWTDGAGADVVIECVGRPETWSEAQRLAATGGVVLLYGGCASGTVATFDTERLHYREIDLKGAFHYGRADVREALDLLERADVRVEPLITHRVPLGRLDEALRLALSREAVKVAVVP